MNAIAEPLDLFDPRLYKGARQPAEVAETLPRWCFLSDAFFERERERIFHKLWFCIGHESRVPNAGSYISFRYAGVPIVVVRGEDGRIRGFLNACTHRGAEVVSGEGECKFMKCPYHAWTYSHAGELVGMPLVEESKFLRKVDMGLKPIRLEMWAGLMWINLDPKSEDLFSYLGDLPERCAPWKLEEMTCVARTSFRMKANWKLHFENFSDTYHVPFVHKSTLNWKTVAKRELHDPAVYKGNYIMHYTLFEGTRGVPEGEKAFPPMPLPREMKQGTFFPYVYPGNGMGFSIDSMFISEIYPESPGETTYVRSFLVPRKYLELPDFKELCETYSRGLDTVALQDLGILEAQQRSLESPLYSTGRFTPADKLVHDCEMWVLDRVLDDAGD